MCGEHHPARGLAASRHGSSPRVWGARCTARKGRFPGRLIPTCVGSTFLLASSLPAVAAHPHVCGEHTLCLPLFGLLVGSSPRVWGARSLPPNLLRLVRLIPTCVGSTLTCTSGGAAPTAHPHVCGEHIGPVSPQRRVRGSSPRVWGAQLWGCAGLTGGRLIPTCVGSTRCRYRYGKRRSAHPHVCGEHFSPKS